MKAAVFCEHGGPEVLQLVEAADPSPAPGEVLVRLHVAAVNRLDRWVREGWPGLKLVYPHILGADGAGVVHAVGEGVNTFSENDRVVIGGVISCGRCEYCLAGHDNWCPRAGLLGESTGGTYCEYIAVPARNLLKIPDHISLEESAAASLVGLTAWHSLITRGRLAAGESVLIVGAGGGVNTASIRIAKLAGAHVTVIGSSEAKCRRARELGADAAIDRSQHEDWSGEVRRLTNKRGMDVVVDNVGSATISMSLASAGRGGRILTVGNTSGPLLNIDNRMLFFRHVAILGSTMGPIADFHTVMRLVFDKRLAVPIDSTFALQDVCAAHRRMEGGEFFGKIVLRI